MNKYNYIPLTEPVPITEHKWPEGTLPLVSTSTNTYNHAPYIRDCIEGLIMQKTTFPVRIVIFDDASTGGTREIVKEYEAKYPQLIIGIYPDKNTWGKKEERREALKPRNKARNVAKYIALCEGDDYWTDPLKLQRQVELLEKDNSIALSAENGLVKYVDTNREGIFNKEKNNTFYGILEMLEERRFPTSSVMFRGNYIQEMSTYRKSGDTILWTLLATKGKVHFNPVISSVYNRGKHGVVQGTDKLKWALEMEQWNEQLKEIVLGYDRNFDCNIFNKRNLSEFSAASKIYSFKRNPLKKIYAYYKMKFYENKFKI